MKRRHSYWAGAIEFPQDYRTEIERFIKPDAAQFIDEMQQAAYEFREHQNAEIFPDALKAMRAEFENIADHARAAALALKTLNRDGGDLLDQSFALEKNGSNRRTTEGQLKAVARICSRAASFKAMTPTDGVPADVSKHGLVRRCAEAYRAATGNEPARATGGTFARVLLIVMRAARAVPADQKTVSKELLVKVLGER